MNSVTRNLVFAAVVLGALPAAAQVKTTPQNTRLNQAVERAVAAARQPDGCTCGQCPLSVQEIIEAEEELQHIRNTQNSNATFSQYPYLLDPAYRRKGTACPCTAPQTVPQSQAEEPEELDPRELIEAEEELSLIINLKDNHATFEKYPYLLDPQYRRGTEEQRQKIRQAFVKSQSTWARKVGM